MPPRGADRVCGRLYGRPAGLAHPGRTGDLPPPAAAVPAVYAPTRLPWPAAIAKLLAERGLGGLYSHQALATDHLRAGHSIVAATPTASGKSLIYNLPVLERCLADPDARALYLFPLKALAQDQLAGFNALAAAWPPEVRPRAALYDGDTSDYARAKSGATRPPCSSAIQKCSTWAFCPTTSSGRLFWPG